MLAKIFQKCITTILFGSILLSCAPKYAANFQNKSYKMNRYTVEDVKKENNAIVADAEVKAELPDIKIKEVVIEEDVEKLTSEESTVIKPQSKEELIRALQENPNSTVALQLNKKEKKELRKSMREAYKDHKKSADAPMYRQAESKLLYYLLAIFLPPLAVGLWRGIGSDFWINLLLTLLLFLPGIIHAIIVISNKPKREPVY